MGAGKGGYTVSELPGFCFGCGVFVLVLMRVCPSCHATEGML
jgi:hypothetical protein